MYGTGTKKMLNLMILEILEKYSDAAHSLTHKKIIELLELEYGMTCNRRTVAKNLDSLREMGHDIIKNPDGVHLVRDFEDWELRMLIDSVLFANFISTSKAKVLIDKLQNLGNKHFSAKVKHIVNLPELNHTSNLSVGLTLDAINDAISRGKKISFTYTTYGEDLELHARRAAPYIVNPYQMVATNGRYYLIANGDKYDDFTHYRVDKIRNVKILDEAARPIRDFAPNGLNLPRHMAEHLYMFTGESARVKFWVDSGGIDSLVDWFGRDVDILQRSGGRLLISVRVNLQAMKYWVMQFGEHVEVVEPRSLREEICKAAEKIRATHAAEAAEIPAAAEDFAGDLPRVIVVGAGNFGAGVVEALRARGADELEFIDEVEFIALSDEDLRRTSSEPIHVGGFKFTAWSFDPAIQRRLDEVDLIVIITNEASLNSAAAFVAGSKATKVFVQPDAIRESTGGSIFVRFDAADFEHSAYNAICGLSEVVYGDGLAIGADFEELDENFLRGHADEFVMSFGAGVGDSAEDDALSAALARLEGGSDAVRCLYVGTAPEVGDFAKIVERLRGAFSRAKIFYSFNVDDSMPAGTASAMLIVAAENPTGADVKVLADREIAAIDGVRIISAESAGRVTGDLVFVVAESGNVAGLAERIDGALRILITDAKVDACAAFDAYFISSDAEKIIRWVSDVILSEGDFALDFADLMALMKNSGEAVAIFGEGDTLAEAVEVALKAAGEGFGTAREVVVNITGVAGLHEIDAALTTIKAGLDDDAEVMWIMRPGEGADKFTAAIIATRFGA